MKHNRRKSMLRAFTLVELLVVIIIIAILAALLLTAIAGALRYARKAKAVTEAKALESGIKFYYEEYNTNTYSSNTAYINIRLWGRATYAFVWSLEG